MLLADLAEVSDQVAGSTARNDKVALLGELLARADPTELEIVVPALCGAPRQGRIGVGWAQARLQGSATAPTLEIGDLDSLISQLGAAHGPGVQATRKALMDSFGARATEREAAFVVRLLTGEMRQGALAGVVEQAVAKAEGVPIGVVRRAAMLTGDLADTAVLARSGGRAALDGVQLRLGVPVAPMLAAGAESVADAMATVGSASVEWKLDGIRAQAHVRGDRVRIFTRNLHDVTERLSAIASELASLGLPATVLDGEVIGDRGHWFDVLHHDGVDQLDEPLRRRLEVLRGLSGLARVRSEQTSDHATADAVMASSLEAGHEGVVVKALDSPYAAGRRGTGWHKVKPVHTLDLVVIGVEWGSGRRQGTLSNLHLAAIGSDGEPVMVGKTFKGLTDELLEWQTAELLARETGREGHIVWVRPELVVEIALDGAQRSTRYPGGVALRFARVRRYRSDKTAAEADRLDEVRALLP